jgi:hypothetical protein
MSVSLPGRPADLFYDWWKPEQGTNERANKQHISWQQSHWVEAKSHGLVAKEEEAQQPKCRGFELRHHVLDGWAWRSSYIETIF